MNDVLRIRSTVGLCLKDERFRQEQNSLSLSQIVWNDNSENEELNYLTANNLSVLRKGIDEDQLSAIGHFKILEDFESKLDEGDSSFKNRLQAYEQPSNYREISNVHKNVRNQSKSQKAYKWMICGCK